MFTVLAMTGTRVVRLLGLQWPDVDFERTPAHTSLGCGMDMFKHEERTSTAPLPLPEHLAEPAQYREHWRPNPNGFCSLLGTTDHPHPTKREYDWASA